MSKARTIPGQRLVGRLLQREALATGVDDRSPLLRRFGRSEEGLPTLSYLSGAAYYQERDQWLARRFSGRASLTFQRREWSSASWMSWKEGSAGAGNWSADRLPAAVFLNQAQPEPNEAGRSAAAAPVSRRFRAAPLPATVLRALDVLSASVGQREASRVQDEVLRLSSLSAVEQGPAVRRLVRRLGGVQATVRRRLDRASHTLQVGPGLIPQRSRRPAVARRAPGRSTAQGRSSVRSVPRGRPAAGLVAEATITSAAVRDAGDQQAAGRAGPVSGPGPVARSPLVDADVWGIEQDAADEASELTWLDALEGHLQEGAPEVGVGARSVGRDTVADALQAVFSRNRSETELGASQLARHLSGAQPTRPAERPLLRSWAAQSVRPGVLRGLSQRAGERSRAELPASDLPMERAARSAATPVQTLLNPEAPSSGDPASTAQVSSGRAALGRAALGRAAPRTRVEPTSAVAREPLAPAERSGGGAPSRVRLPTAGGVGSSASRYQPGLEAQAASSARRSAPTPMTAAEARALPRRGVASADAATLRWDWHGTVPVATASSHAGVRQTAPDRGRLLGSSGRPVPRRVQRSVGFGGQRPLEQPAAAGSLSSSRSPSAPSLLREGQRFAALAQQPGAADRAAIQKAALRGSPEGLLGEEAVSVARRRAPVQPTSGGLDQGVPASAPGRFTQRDSDAGPGGLASRLGGEARPSSLRQPNFVTLEDVDGPSARVEAFAAPAAGAGRYPPRATGAQAVVGSSKPRPALRRRLEAQASPVEARLESWWVAPQRLGASPQVPRWSSLATPQLVEGAPPREAVVVAGSPKVEGGVARGAAPRVRWVAGPGSASSALAASTARASFREPALARTSPLAPSQRIRGPGAADAGWSRDAEADSPDGTVGARAPEAASRALSERPMLKIAARGEAGPTPGPVRPLLATVLSTPTAAALEPLVGSGSSLSGAPSRRSRAAGASPSAAGARRGAGARESTTARADEVGAPSTVSGALRGDSGGQRVRPVVRFVPASRLRARGALETQALRDAERPSATPRSSERTGQRSPPLERSGQTRGAGASRAGATAMEASLRPVLGEAALPPWAGVSSRSVVAARAARTRRLDAAAARERSLTPRAVQVQRLEASESSSSWFQGEVLPGRLSTPPERAVLLGARAGLAEAGSATANGPGPSGTPAPTGRVRGQGAAQAGSAAPGFVARRARDLGGEVQEGPSQGAHLGLESPRRGAYAAPVRRAMARLVPGFDGDSDLPRPAVGARLASATESSAPAYASWGSPSAGASARGGLSAEDRLDLRSPSGARTLTERLAAQEDLPQGSYRTRVGSVGRALVSDLGAPLPTLLVASAASGGALDAATTVPSAAERGERRRSTGRRSGRWAALTRSLEAPAPPRGAGLVPLVPTLLAALRDVVPVGVSSSAEREGTLAAIPADRTRSPLSAPLLRSSESRFPAARRTQAATFARGADASPSVGGGATSAVDALAGWWTGQALESELEPAYASGLDRQGLRRSVGDGRSRVAQAPRQLRGELPPTSGWVQEAGELIWLAPPVEPAEAEPVPATTANLRRASVRNTAGSRRAALAGAAQRAGTVSAARANPGERAASPEAGPASRSGFSARKLAGASPLRWLLSGQTWWSAEGEAVSNVGRPTAGLRAEAVPARDSNQGGASAPSRRRRDEAPFAVASGREAQRPEPVVLAGQSPETQGSSQTLGVGQLGATFRRGVQAQARGLERALANARGHRAAPSLRALLSGLEGATPSGSANVIRGLLANWAELERGGSSGSSGSSGSTASGWGATVRGRLTARLAVPGQEGGSAPGVGAGLAALFGGARAPAASLRLDWLSAGRAMGELGGAGALPTLLAAPEGETTLDAAAGRARRPVWPQSAGPRRSVGRRRRTSAAATVGDSMPIDADKSGPEAPALVSAVQRDEPWAAARLAEPNVRRLQERGQEPRAGESVRSSEGLVRALARATRPEDVVQLITSQGLSARLLADELPGAAGRLVQQIREQSAPAESRPTVRTVRQEVLRPVRTFGGSIQGVTGSAQHGRGVGASNVMKLAGKLMKLIHLAESERRLRDAQSQVRMAEDTHDARSEGSAGAVNDAKKADKVDIQALQQEVLEAVLRELELLQARREDPDGRNKWW